MTEYVAARLAMIRRNLADHHYPISCGSDVRFLLARYDEMRAIPASGGHATARALTPEQRRHRRQNTRTPR